MGNFENKELDSNDIQVFYDDYDYIINDEQPSSAERNIGAHDQNEMLWSFAKDNRIALFMHVKPGSNTKTCCELRQKILHPEPMPEYEYRNPNNQYCSCMVYDAGRNDFTLMGFILYRTIDKNLYLLDIVFCLDQSIWDESFPELYNLNIPLTCINAFHNFVVKSGYKCIWRKRILLDRIFRKKLGVNRPRIYKSIGLQRNQMGSGKVKML